jgi:hypothetical protein
MPIRQYPLNKFARTTVKLSDQPAVVYSAKPSRASIILLALGSNVSNDVRTVTLALSSNTELGSTPSQTILNEAPIGPNDAANLTIGKLVIVEGDHFIANCDLDEGVNLTLSILETINTD